MFCQSGAAAQYGALASEVVGGSRGCTCIHLNRKYLQSRCKHVDYAQQTKCAVKTVQRPLRLSCRGRHGYICRFIYFFMICI